MRNLILHELQKSFYGLRFPITICLVLFMFAASSLTYINEYKDAVQKHNTLTTFQEDALRETAKNASSVVTKSRNYQMPPRSNGFISDCNEMNLPNALSYTAYYDIKFSSDNNKDNPFIMPTNRINWGFIIIILFGFLALIYTFDAVSGEKEQHTLALCLSNPVKRSHILLSKYIAVNILLLSFALIGMILATIILMLSPAVSITAQTLSETGLFLFFVAFFIGSMTAIGLFTSVMSRNSSVSLLLSVSFWLLFLIAVPNISQTIGMSLHPVEKANITNQKMWNKRSEIEASFPEGKWRSHSGNPFIPQHEIRANMQMAFAKSAADFRAEHIKEQLRQADITRQLTWISPLSVFGYGQEALLDGGLSRLRKNYTDLQNFKIQYLQWFKELDAKDEDSPHWYNPVEDYSTTKKPVAYEEIPQYTERITTIVERFSEIVKYLMVLLAYVGVMFFVTILRFEKYDAR